MSKLRYEDLRESDQRRPVQTAGRSATQHREHGLGIHPETIRLPLKFLGAGRIGLRRGQTDNALDFPTALERNGHGHETLDYVLGDRVLILDRADHQRAQQFAGAGERQAAQVRYLSGQRTEQLGIQRPDRYADPKLRA